MNTVVLDFVLTHSDHMACKCGCGLLIIRPDVVIRYLGLESIAANKGVFLRFTSWTRCAKHNKTVGGNPLSWHIQGCAIDIIRDMPDVPWFLSQARSLFTDVIDYPEKKIIHAELELTRI